MQWSWLFRVLALFVVFVYQAVATKRLLLKVKGEGLRIREVTF